MSNFFQNSDLSLEKAEKIVSDTLSKCDDGELYLEDNISESFVFDDNVLKNTSYNEFKGFGLRAVADELIGYSHSSEISLDSLKKASQTVSLVKSGFNCNTIADPKKTNNKFKVLKWDRETAIYIPITIEL